jgi:ParB family chromosome partitioning protein
MGHARTLVSIEDPKDQLRLFYQVIEKELSVRKAEELARKFEHDLMKKAKEQTLHKEGPQPYEVLKNQLAEFFNTNILFQRSNNGKGKIVIPFRSDDELERIIGIFDRLKD